jgi:membrane protein implicated in regulation of membrane protease activity
MFKDRFSKSINALTLLIAGAILIFKGVQDKIVLNNLVWVALFYFYFLSIAIYFISKSGLKKDNKTFITRIYSSIGKRIKLHN